MAVRFWREDVIQRIELCRHPLASSYPGNFFGSISRLLSFVSVGPNLVSVSGCPSAVLQTLDRSDLFKFSLQYPFRFEVLSLPKLMHQAPVGADSSPPRKRRRMLCKPGKVMKDAYFKGIQWTRLFVSGPLDPLHNRYKFYCQICKTNISIYSKGARENLRHYKTQGHLRRDQKWRYEHLREIDATTGKVTHQVRGKDD